VIQGVEASPTQHPCFTLLFPVSRAWDPLSPPAIRSKSEPALQRQRAAALPGEPGKSTACLEERKNMVLTAAPGCSTLGAASSSPLAPDARSGICLHPWVGNVQDGSGKAGAPQATPHAHSYPQRQQKVIKVCSWTWAHVSEQG